MDARLEQLAGECAMRGLWDGSRMIISLVLLERQVKGDTWWPAIRPSPNAASANEPSFASPIVTLGPPQTMDHSAASQENQRPRLDGTLVPGSYDSTARNVFRPIIRPQNPLQ